MVNYKEYIKALKKCAMEHENDTVPTGNIVVSDLCRDTARLLEGLLESLSDPSVEDCISRKQVLHWLENATDESIENALNNNLDFIPPVTPQVSKDEVVLSNKEYRELIANEYDHGYVKGYQVALEEQGATFNKMRTEIDDLKPNNPNFKGYHEQRVALNKALEVVDKYIEESEG